jgi:hypothetical protein
VSLAAAQTGTPDPRPAGPFADPERAQAQVWDELVAAAVKAACTEAGWDWEAEPAEHIPSAFDAMEPIVMAALKVIQAERAGEAEAEVAAWEREFFRLHADEAKWDWGVMDDRGGNWPGATAFHNEADARLRQRLAGGRVVRRIPAGPWEPAPAEGGA